MKTVWIQADEDKEQLKKALATNVYLQRMRGLLEDELRDLDRKEISPDYTSPSWSHQQAHRNGFRQHLKQTIELLTFEKE